VTAGVFKAVVVIDVSDGDGA